MVGLGDLKGPNQVGNVLPLRMGSKNESGALEIEMEVWRFVKGRLAFLSKAGEIQGLLHSC
jgi:hypothetical protein